MENMHNIVGPVTTKEFDTQFTIIDSNGDFVCNTLRGNDEANAKFIVEALNKALVKIEPVQLTKPQEKEIVDKYRLGKHTFKQLANEYGITVLEAVNIWDNA